MNFYTKKKIDKKWEIYIYLAVFSICNNLQELAYIKYKNTIIKNNNL
jgi:hypothetical protein